MKSKIFKGLALLLTLALGITLLINHMNKNAQYKDIDAFLDNHLSGNGDLRIALQDYYIKDGVCDQKLISSIQERLASAPDERTYMWLTSDLAFIDYMVDSTANNKERIFCDYTMSSDTSLQAFLTLDLANELWWYPEEKDSFESEGILYSAVHQNPARARQVADIILSANISEKRRMSALKKFRNYFISREAIDVAWELLPDLLEGDWFADWFDDYDVSAIVSAKTNMDALIYSKKTRSGEVDEKFEIDEWLSNLEREVLTDQRFGKQREKLEAGIIHLIRDRFKGHGLAKAEEALAVLHFLARGAMTEKSTHDLGLTLDLYMYLRMDRALIKNLKDNDATGAKPSGTVLILQDPKGEDVYLDTDAMLSLPGECLPETVNSADIMIVQSESKKKVGFYTNNAPAYSCTVTARAYDAATGDLLAVIDSYTDDPPPKTISSQGASGSAMYHKLRPAIMEWVKGEGTKAQ